MGLLERGKVKQVIGNTQFSLTAGANESFRIRDIRVFTPLSNYATINIDKTSVGYWRVGNTTTAKMGNHLAFGKKNEEVGTLLAYLIAKGLFRMYPVATGQVFTIDGVHQATSVVQVIYDRYDANDVKSTEPNGSEAKEYDVMSYGINSGSGVLTAGDTILDTCVNPAQFSQFPFEKAARNNYKTEILGICFSDLGGKTVAGESRTQYLKLIRNRTVLQDDDKNGLLYYGTVPAAAANEDIALGQSRAGNYSDIDEREPLIFVDALPFIGGDELETYINTAVVSVAMSLSVVGTECAYMIREQQL